MPNEIKHDDMWAEATPQCCEHCAYFQENHWGVGYCQLHSMNVIRTFACSHFLQKSQQEAQGGDASSG